MKRSVAYLLFSVAVASTLAACAATPAPAEETPMVCRETGLTNAQDSKLGQLECTPDTNKRSASAKYK